MTDLDEWDGWGPDESLPMREIPDCPDCNDSGIISRRPVRRPSWRRPRPLPQRRGWRQCPGCDPTRLDRVRGTLYWRWHSLRARLGWGTTTDEAPF